MPLPPASQAAEITGFPLSRPLQNGSKLGSFFPVLSVALVEADTVVPIKLGRQPSGYIVVRSPNGGGVVTDGANGGTDWNPSQIVLATNKPGNYSVLVF